MGALSGRNTSTKLKTGTFVRHHDYIKHLHACKRVRFIYAMKQQIPNDLCRKNFNKFSFTNLVRHFATLSWRDSFWTHEQLITSRNIPCNFIVRLIDFSHKIIIINYYRELNTETSFHVFVAFYLLVSMARIPTDIFFIEIKQLSV